MAHSYRQKANELAAAASEQLSQYSHRKDPHDKVALLADAIMNAEIEMEDQK